MALTGPAVSLMVALILAALTWWLAGRPAAVDPWSLLWRLSPAGLAATLAMANLALVAVNLIPLFPLDGGRVLRGLLSLRGNLARATRLACGLSLLLAPVVLGVGLWLGAPTVLALAILVLIFSWQELRLLGEMLDDANWRWWLSDQA
jgi:Zn-dependent protease